MIHAIKTGQGFQGTIEFFPEEGKYHYDGHRACGVRLHPRETLQHKSLCPVCGKKLTIGVMHRVEGLADRDEDLALTKTPPFRSIIPLPEIISEVVQVGVNSKRVNNAYLDMLGKLGSEFTILLDSSLDEIERASSPLMREAIAKMRAGDISIAPGYDGEFGKIGIFRDR
jgi:PHP family Zn ribbon phosphoesterase